MNGDHKGDPEKKYGGPCEKRVKEIRGDRFTGIGRPMSKPGNLVSCKKRKRGGGGGGGGNVKQYDLLRCGGPLEKSSREQRKGANERGMKSERNSAPRKRVHRHPADFGPEKEKKREQQETRLAGLGGGISVGGGKGKCGGSF